MNFARVIESMNEMVGKICSLLIPPLFGIILLEVGLRYFFNSPTSWVHESSGYILAAYSVLTGGYALLHNSHVNVDILYSRFSPKIKSTISLFTWPLFFYYLAVIIWRTGESSIFSIQIWERSPSVWGPVFWPIRLLIPIGSIFILLQGLVQFMDNLYFIFKGEKFIKK